MDYVHILVLILSCFMICNLGSSQDYITKTQFLSDPGAIQSSNGTFKLGFFSPINSTNRYVGIWYNIKESDLLEIVWVANRNNPITDSSGVLKISKDGNLQLLNGQNKTFWSSNLTGNEVNETYAQLSENGNFALYSNISDAMIWQSFDHPTDSLILLQMKLPINESLNDKQILFRSWKTVSDPSIGNFTAGVSSLYPLHLFIMNNGRPYWRSNAWDGNVFFGKGSVVSIISDNEGRAYYGFSFGNQSKLQHVVVTYDGNLVLKQWNADTRKWEILWQSRESECDEYSKCGAFGICNPKASPICDCLKGFVPRNKQEWSRGNWTNGCVRKTELQCDGKTKGKSADTFLKLRDTKVPDGGFLVSTNSEDECRSQCLGRCSCLAFSYISNAGCMTWNDSLIDTQTGASKSLINTKGVDLSLRLAASELDKSDQQQSSVDSKDDKKKIILLVILLIGTTTIVLIIMFCLWRQLSKRNGLARVMNRKARRQNSRHEDVTSREFGDLPMFEFEKLANATDNFQEKNKLGKGGFGPVYKGKLEDGQEIAVKRLSKVSGQGLQEFMNEVLVISKLQHRNLVKLLGCCVEGEEKLLVYEYMPNKSLDALLFDLSHKKLLDWRKRFNIILGICRGLLYLHRDSKLRIIHRDLKASNILLDGNLNSKISDFGMARIFGDNEVQGDTKRICGTYGYMSPEYAMEGQFSEKSDVFSFGVLLLEIVSGRRNSSFRDEESLSLLCHAWKLWNEDDIFALIDPTISESVYLTEILRCLQLGLLCVQEFPQDRPSISNVLCMIENELTVLPHPKQPGFTLRRSSSGKPTQHYGHEYCSNWISVSSFTGR
ncbi:unnamed protein product [Amaranthus hypochondriacus]